MRPTVSGAARRCLGGSPGFSRTAWRWGHSKVYDDRNAKPFVIRGGLGLRNGELVMGRANSKAKKARSPRPAPAGRADAPHRHDGLPGSLGQQKMLSPGSPQLPSITGLQRLVDPLDGRGLDMVKTMRNLQRQRDLLQRRLRASALAAEVAAEAAPPGGGAEDFSWSHTSANYMQLQTEIEHLDQRLDTLRAQRRRQKHWLKDEVYAAAKAALPLDETQSSASLAPGEAEQSLLPGEARGSTALLPGEEADNVLPDGTRSSVTQPQGGEENSLLPDARSSAAPGSHGDAQSVVTPGAQGGKG